MVKKNANDTPAPSADEITENLTNALLRETIEKLEDQKVKLLLNIKGLVEKLAQQKSDQADIYFYLNKKLDDNYEVISSLEEQILTEQSDREQSEKMYEKQIEDMKAKQANEEHKLNSRIMDLEEKLQILKEFSDQKQELDENLLKLFDTLENERRQFQTTTEEMERKAAFDRDKLKKEYESLIVQYKSDIQGKVDARLTKTTKNTQAANLVMQNELKYQSNTVEKMLHLTDSVLEKDRDLQMELSIAQTNETEIVHRLATYQRVIKQLNTKIEQDETDRVELIQTHESKVLLKNEEIHRLKQQLESIECNMEMENQQLDELWKAMSETYAYIQHRKKKLSSSVVAKRNEPVDHDEMLCEVFYRVAKKYPGKFRRLLGKFGGGSIRMSSANSIGSENSIVSTSSKDSLLFPSIRSISKPAIFPPIQENNVPKEISLSPQASVIIGQEARKKNRGRIVNDTSDDDETYGGSLATGIPSWDKGVEANESMATS